MPLNREALAKSRKPEEVEIDGLEDSVCVQQISAWDGTAIRKRFASLSEDENGDYEDVVAELVVATLVDENGERLYHDNETEQIRKDLGLQTLLLIGQESMRVCGFTGGDDRAKKSKASRKPK
tara:strand:+ start:8354 stop:8722 length:369 start_codon:yes stop_codon:yes gene_type:complete